jgi:hypothetical protein
MSRAKGGYGSIVNGGESTLLARLGLGAPPPRPSVALPTDEEWREISRILFGQQPLSREARERIAAELPAWSDAATIATAQAVPTHGPEPTRDSSAVLPVDPLTGRHMQQVDPKSIEELEVISLGPPTMLELREGWLRLSVIEDTERNELLLHPRIHERLAADPLLDFESLNRWVYASVFLTPREDPWLGLVDPSIHTALPGDGIVAAGN